MGMRLTSHDDGTHFDFSTVEWHKLIELAQEYGWQPAGTQLDEANWSGTYLSNDGQTVTQTDALALGNALDAAAAQLETNVTRAKIAVIVMASPPFTPEATRQIDEIVGQQRELWKNPDLQVDVISYDPDEEWLRKMISQPEKRMGHVLSMHNYRLSPGEMFSGQMPRLTVFAAFCKDGAFDID
jgi:hypothetical protein